ncbi:MAG: flagellar basal body P-ring protein FlgI [Halobacteriovoraceae bacterium]|nr:flagellar basal body P-ring protein FlgI [Halobacteriovoraceae bacterium]
MKILLILAFITSPVWAAPVRLKDLVTVKGVRSNPIIGYGLVIGLNGTGDGSGEIVDKSLKKMLQKLGIGPEQELSSSNIASVIVTAKLPPFARVGQKIDATVSSIGKASSLAGGTLLVTPMKGGDGEIYAIASGALSIGGLKKGAKFATTGAIPGGVVVEKELNLDFDKKKSLRFGLNHPDFTTSARIEKILNQNLGGKYATSRDAATVDLIIPVNYQGKVVQLMAIIENYKANADMAAKIVINERTGTVVAGGDIVLKPVAIGHANLSIEIAGGEEGDFKSSLHFMDKEATLKDLVNGLNALGTTTEDMLSIFQALKRNGSLVSDIELI